MARKKKAPEKTEGVYQHCKTLTKYNLGTLKKEITKIPQTGLQLQVKKKKKNPKRIPPKLKEKSPAPECTGPS